MTNKRIRIILSYIRIQKIKKRSFYKSSINLIKTSRNPQPAMKKIKKSSQLKEYPQKKACINCIAIDTKAIYKIIIIKEHLGLMLSKHRKLYKRCQKL